MGALFHRERTGEATDRRRVAARRRPVVDGRGAGAVAPARACRGRRRRPGQPTRNPLVGDLPHQGRHVRLALLPAGRPATGPTRARLIGRPELATDERFADAAALRENAAEAAETPRARRSPRAPSTSGATRLEPTSPASGRSSRTRSRRPTTRRPWPTATSPTARRPTAPRSSSPPRRCSTTSSRPSPTRAPEFNEHGDEILAEHRPRHGRHRRPQGPRRRRLSSEIRPGSADPAQERSPQCASE